MTDKGEEPLLATAAVHVLRDDGLVRLRDGHLVVTTREGTGEPVRLDEIAQVSLLGEAGITSPCLRELMRRGIPVIWRSPGGHYAGQTVDLSGRMATVRRAQYRAADDPAAALAIARVLVRAKIINARGQLRRSAGRNARTLRELRRLGARTENASAASELMGIEGAAAAAYYATMASMIAPARRDHFVWDGRRRRPPGDPVNALLSYVYAVVAGECAAAALGAGLDPAIGFLHAERPGRPALALDLLEPFRPVVADAVVLALINRGEVGPQHFQSDDGGIRLVDPGRRIVIGGIERRLDDAVPKRSQRQGTMTWRDAIAAQARMLASALRTGTMPAIFERP